MDQLPVVPSMRPCTLGTSSCLGLFGPVWGINQRRLQGVSGGSRVHVAYIAYSIYVLREFKVAQCMHSVEITLIVAISVEHFGAVSYSRLLVCRHLSLPV